MDIKERKIRERLTRLAKEHGPQLLFDGSVTATDPDSYLVDVELDTGEVLFDCRLRALATGNESIDVMPAIGSAVVIAKIDESDYLVLCADQIASYRVAVGEMVLLIDDGGFTLGNGTETLGKILTDLVRATLSIAAPKDAATLTALMNVRIKTILK